MRRETGKRWTVEVRHGEGVATAPAPSYGAAREGSGEAFHRGGRRRGIERRKQRPGALMFSVQQKATQPVSISQDT